MRKITGLGLTFHSVQLHPPCPWVLWFGVLVHVAVRRLFSATSIVMVVVQFLLPVPVAMVQVIFLPVPVAVVHLQLLPVAVAVLPMGGYIYVSIYL